MLPLFLIAASVVQPIGTMATQRRVDAVVRQCAAGDVVQLSAMSRDTVAISMLIVGRAPTMREDRRFACVLARMRSMRDLHFGFLGNETAPER